MATGTRRDSELVASLLRVVESSRKDRTMTIETVINTTWSYGTPSDGIPARGPSLLKVQKEEVNQG